MMNLENTKVYTTDPEVIRKYAELCGKTFERKITPWIGVYNCNSYKINDFIPDSPVDFVDEFTEITPDQINTLHAERFGKVETPEEAKALAIMAQDNEQLQNYEMGGETGKCLEWEAGDHCVFKGEAAVVIGWHPEHPVLVIDSDANGFIGITDLSLLSKPETPQQREERERLEEIDKMSKIVEMKNGFAGNAYKKYCTALYDAGYRKQKDGE